MRRARTARHPTLTHPICTCNSAKAHNSPEETGDGGGTDEDARARARPTALVPGGVRTRVLGELGPIVMCIASCDMFRNRHVPWSPTR